jgi:hypothetical protein
MDFEPGTRCPQCEQKYTVVTPDTAHATANAFSAGVVLEGPDGEKGGRRVDYRSPKGGRALSIANSIGGFRAELQGPLDVGRSNEPRVLKTLVAFLRSCGHQAALLPPEQAQDQSGEDGMIELDGSSISAQVVSAPPDSKLWGRVSRGPVNREGSVDDAVMYLWNALEKKRDYDQSMKRKLWLVIDGSYFGALNSPAVVEAYLRAHGDPTKEFGFAKVWIVGPTVNTCQPIIRGS